MADNQVHAGGWVTAVLSIFLGVLSKITVSELAGWMSITVGAYSLFINWPKFKERALIIISGIQNWWNETFTDKK